MKHGLYLNGPTLIGWTSGDSTLPFPGGVPVCAGATLVDLSRLDQDAAQIVIACVARALPEARHALIAAYPTITVTPEMCPPAPPGYELELQPGYRRICHRPTAEWYEQEVTARLRANARLAAGEPIQEVCEQEFSHVPDVSGRRQRIAAALPTTRGGAAIPLTPMVKVVDCCALAGSQVERRFPWHQTVAEW